MSDATSDQVATVSDQGAPTTAATAAVTVEQAAALLGVSITTVRRRIRAGTIRAEEARRPQGPLWLVYLPADAAPATASDQSATVSDHTPPTVAATAPTTASDAMIAYTQTLLTPLVAALERAQARVAELERENGRLTATVDALQAQNGAVDASGAPQPSDPSPEPPPQPDPSPVPLPPTPNAAPWWRRWLSAVYG